MPPRKKDFDTRLAHARARRGRRRGGKKSAAPGGSMSGGMSGSTALGAAMRVATDLVAALGVGTAIGWGLDWWLGTNPWLLLVFFVLGSAAGIRNVMRSAMKIEKIAQAVEIEKESGAAQPGDSSSERPARDAAEGGERGS